MTRGKMAGGENGERGWDGSLDPRNCIVENEMFDFMFKSFLKICKGMIYSGKPSFRYSSSKFL